MDKPIVMPRSSRYGNNYWNSKGLKVGRREVILYSDLEYDHWLTVEANFNVETYCEQEKEISYVFNGKVHTSILDMYIRHSDGTELYVEVKYECELQPSHKNYERTRRQIEAQRIWCEQKGYLYEVRTEKTIRISRFYIENLTKIVMSVTNLPKPASWAEILDHISESKQTLGEIWKELMSTVNVQELQTTCHWLFYEGRIGADICTKIWGNEMEVWKL
ncbi:TnsA endonuclease N-terminal domain-containing protein [Paenibacillus glycanilyticus]|uniref:TnsA endonuclease N-terminal domain-containing protein n=1 Tax=Paenibacillus glycanilyticus TaxID=126569 RepID=UPI00203D165A|nr:TnsA endonuclease N-terminal domain-containing protein [Paenibacillus glycanilyticus]MCM3625776.1 TnsA endonuclease N-terminal domain-containing protein [Paenibacillus glycanilyticus]